MSVKTGVCSDIGERKHIELDFVLRNRNNNCVQPRRVETEFWSSVKTGGFTAARGGENMPTPPCDACKLYLLEGLSQVFHTQNTFVWLLDPNIITSWSHSLLATLLASDAHGNFKVGADNAALATPTIDNYRRQEPFVVDGLSQKDSEDASNACVG
jgi:hypothetical protein